MGGPSPRIRINTFVVGLNNPAAGVGGSRDDTPHERWEPVGRSVIDMGSS